MKLVLTLLGWSWILLGVWWFFRPARIRKWLQKRFHKGARGLLVAGFFAIAGFVFTAGRQIGGVPGVLLAVLGCIAALKGLLLVRGKVSNRFLEWAGRQPDWTYRVAAAALFALGVMMQWVVAAGGESP